MKLTERQRKFVEYYDGNATDAARKAGYQGSDTVLGKTGFDLLRNPKIKELISVRQAKLDKPIIAKREERESRLTEIIRNSTNEAAVIKAVDVLNKMNGEYIQRVEHSGKITYEDLIQSTREGDSDVSETVAQAVQGY